MIYYASILFLITIGIIYDILVKLNSESKLPYHNLGFGLIISGIIFLVYLFSSKQISFQTTN